MQKTILEYRATLNHNSEVFLLNFKDEFTAFTDTDNSLYRIGLFLSQNRTKDEESLISFLPYLLIMQRQFRNAFQCFTVFQSYQGWVLLRPGLESSLIMGKWLDDMQNVEIWKKHKQDWKEYNKTYSGKSLISKSLPESSSIQQVLKRINDNFMHVNPSYYYHNTRLEQMQADSDFLYVPVFDQETDYQSHLYSFLHLTLYVVKCVGEMLVPYFSQNDTFEINLARLEEAFKGKVARILQQSPDQLSVLTELGLWPNNTFQRRP